jgi:hypothetical protein
MVKDDAIPVTQEANTVTYLVRLLQPRRDCYDWHWR